MCFSSDWTTISFKLKASMLFDEESSSSDDAYSNNGLSYNWPNRRSWNAARLFAPEKLNGQRATLLAIFLGYFGLILT